MANQITEAMRTVLKPVGTLPLDAVEERLLDARRTYKLNFGYAALSSLPVTFLEMVKRFNPHITELDLSSNNLTDLPDDLEELRFMRILRLKYNQLKKMPAVVTKLPQLMILELSGNQLTRVEDSIGQMVMLRELDLSGNMLQHLSDNLGLLPKLEVLQLENNRLEVLPETLGELPALVKLDLSTNSLRFLPASMGSFKRIQRIDCANNLLAKVPPSMGHLKLLKEFNLRYNSLDDRYKAKVDEGLSRFLAFLREEEERERLEEIERLKPIGTPVGAYLEYRCKVEVGQVVKTEVGEITVDNRCWIRSGHTLTQVGSMLIVFGGTLMKDSSTTNDVYWMTMDRMEWHLQPCKGDKPPPRYNHCAVFDMENNRLIVFGGRTAERKRLNDIYFLDLESFTWYRPSIEGTPPSPREQAVCTFWAGNMVIFGGHAIGGRTNDLFLLDLTGWQWSQPATAGTAPSPRQASALCIGHGNLLFVHGGRNNFVLEDLHVLDFVSKVWIEINPGGRLPPPRHSHMSTVHKNYLYLFGGLDELGAQSFAMYCMHLPPGESYSVTRPEWVEWESELPYNKCRTATFFNGALSVYQLGSTTLGRANDEDVEKGLVYWDVFKAVRLENLKPRQLDEDELKPKNAKRMRVQHTINIASKMPRSFSTQSGLENKILAYVQDYQRIFEELYPHRRQLYLLPKNECNLPKLVCTTIRPSQLSYSELYDLDGCCAFVADFVAYEALEDPLHPPEYLPSPLSTLNWQAGDAFDMAVVLCSLLVGVGYNAYVVVGYAPPAVTSNDQSQTSCPVLEREAQETRSSGQAGAKDGAPTKTSSLRRPATEEKPAEQKKPKYVVRPPLSLESNFLKLQAAKKAAAEAEATAAAAAVKKLSLTGSAPVAPSPQSSVRSRASAQAPASPKPASDKEAGSARGSVAGNGAEHAGSPEPEGVAADGQAAVEATAAAASGAPAAAPARPPVLNWRNPQGASKLVHAWVLVMPGKRDASEPMFVEPSTGRKYPVQQSPYLGVEFLWNHQNFWVCMQMPLPHSDSRALPADISLDLSDVTKWEAVFEHQGERSLLEQAADEYESRNALESRAGLRSATGKPNQKSLVASLAAKGGGAALSHALGATMNSTRRQQSSLALGADTTPPRTAESHMESQLSGDEEGGEQELVPDMPPSWVPKLSIPRDAFDMRCPRGSKLTLYHCSQHEIFALFGDCSRWDGMVEKLLLYQDEERTQLKEVREKFQRRKDKLRERRSLLLKDTVHEVFDGGSSFGLKDILTIKNEKRVMNFFHTARLDGLVQREEIEGHKVIELFEGRDDRLVYRSATYQTDMPDAAEGAAEEDGKRGRRMRNKEVKKMLPIRKMTEKFSRDRKLPADKDVAKRVYFLVEGRIRVDFHYGDACVTHSSHVFQKDGQSQIVQVDPLAERPQPGSLLEEYQALLVAEKDCMQSIRDSEWEISEIIRTRTNQEQNITLEAPYYDIVRIKAEESEEEEEEKNESTYDFLSPFLPPLIGMQQLNREESLQVREKCLKALKDRLIERANIIQARLDEESAALAKRQQNYQRDRDQMTVEEEEEYERAVEESMFRIHILEKRLKRHEEQALHKYYELDHKLRSDPRLAALLVV
ncbi:hypothetical protein V8C86DRAFT_3131553 [Haematococcus lacustris]